MEKITIIIPVHEINNDYLNKAVESVPSNKSYTISIVGPASVINELNNITFNTKAKINLLTNNGDTDFCSQINYGVSECSTKYFSILEMDDTYTPIWFNNFNKYLPHYKDVSVFLPLIKMVKYDNPDIVSLGNELSWSNAFVDENGFIDSECLESYYDFMFSGAIFNTKDFIEYGGLKKSLMIASTYEFLLRMTYNSKKIFTIPKIGYIHTFGNPDSYTMKMAGSIQQKHGEWLIKLAQEEKFFKEDRNKKFEDE
jgi:hypothetical protein